MSLFRKKEAEQLPPEERKKRKKKRLIITMIVIAAVFIFLHFGLAIVVKAAVSGIGPILTGTKMELKHAAIYPILGYVSLGDFTIDNPPGYRSPCAISVKKVVVDFSMLSLFSSKKDLEEITISGVNLYYEQGFSSNNLGDLSNKVNRFQSEKKKVVQKKETAGQGTPVRLQIDRLRVNDITVHTVLSIPGTNYDMAAPLPIVPISMDGLGKGEEGITPTDLFCVIFDNLTLGAASAVGESLGKGMDATADSARSLGKQLKEKGSKAADAAKTLFDSVLPGKK